jgi:transposase-like protein
MHDLARLSVGTVAGSVAVRRTRRSWTLQQKLAIVNEAKASAEGVAPVARRHGMNANHLFNWIQRDREGTLDRHGRSAATGGPMDFVDLGVVRQGGAGAISVPSSVIEIDLPSGARIRVGGAVDAEALRRVLTAVKAAL